jgi:uracil-DNA glycosylase
MFDAQINEFIDDLAKHSLTQNVRNPWDYSRPENEIRRKNLCGYFQKMHQLKPGVLLVGEAPGYRGCGRVGMPFSSEKLILSHPFFSDKEVFGIENVDTPIAEASASIVWKTFDALDFYPLMWATYPYHPHKPGNTASNRAPKSEEIEMGKQFITRLIDIFSVKKIVAVGRIAEKTLSEIGIEASAAIRHPSHGGATLFAQGLSDFKKGLRK